MNGDGKLDVVAGVDTGSGGLVQVYLGNGDGTLQAALSQATSVTDPYEISIARFTGDGHEDVVVAGGIAQPIVWRVPARAVSRRKFCCPWDLPRRLRARRWPRVTSMATVFLT